MLAAWRAPNFERVYDLSERVIPPTVAGLPVAVPRGGPAGADPAGAARCLGVGTVADLADYFWIRPGRQAPRVAELVEDGRLVPVAVEGWDKTGLPVPAFGSRRPPPAARHPAVPVRLAHLDPERTERLFGFHYRIGIYVPGHLRTHGYYVLPLLLGDQLVARFDLKTDRTTNTLQVLGSYLEPAASAATVLEPVPAELHLLRAWLGLDRLLVAPRGDLARGLRRAVAAADPGSGVAG